MSSAAAADSSDGPGEGSNSWRPGTILKLTGLQADASMNGLEVRVEQRCEKDKDRWYVIVLSRNSKVRVHHRNLLASLPAAMPPKRARTAQDGGRGLGSSSPAGVAERRGRPRKAPGQETRQRGGGTAADLAQAAQESVGPQSRESDEAAVEPAQQAQAHVRLRSRGAGGTAAEPTQAAKRARGAGVSAPDADNQTVDASANASDRSQTAKRVRGGRRVADTGPAAAMPVMPVPDEDEQTAAASANSADGSQTARKGRGRPRKAVNGQEDAAEQLPAGTSSSSNAPAEVASAASPQQSPGRDLLQWMKTKAASADSLANAVASPEGSPAPAARRRGQTRVQNAPERLEREEPAAKASASRQHFKEAPAASPRAAAGSSALEQESRNGSNSSPSQSATKLVDVASPKRLLKKTPARTVEQIYQKKTQLEHILLRPDSYVGSIERQRQEMFVLSRKDSAADTDGPRMERRVLEYVPALYKIFDEILVNAADNLARDPTQDLIRITIDMEAKQVSVHNNGKGVPVEMHGEHHCYVPELIFGHLLTSDNYDDDEKKVVGGRNGYGAKLTNIFSTFFAIETADSSRQKRYRQVWSENMTKRAEAEITACGNEDFTCVTFRPDLARFGMSHLEPDIVAIMERRAYDVAASTRGRCRVFLNDKELSVHSFEDYVDLFLPSDTFRVCETYSERWQVAISITDGSGAQQVSMVNSISTTRGGTHVNYIADQAITSIMDRFSKNKEGKAHALAVKPAHVRQYLWIFINCLIENPAFDSQTKETLTTKKDRFGSTCSLSERMLEAVLESGIIDTLTSWSKAMSQSDLARHLNKSDYGKQARLFGIAKLEDANQAGTKNSEKCTLIVTEGDSAKALAVAGLSVVGRDNYGVFPLRGKMRNVRDMTVKQMMENQEIEHLSRILALDATKQYEDVRSLRYGSLMIMADQDFDGSHIKGLMINFISHWFPGLLKAPGFLKEFVTPIVKATKDGETKVFFTIPEYEAWKEEHGGANDWKCKYYKGLGTSTSSEARDYFTDLGQHELTFEHSDEGGDGDLIDMAFNRTRADDRKKWISGCEEGTFVDHSQPSLTYSDFVNKELVLWAQYDVVRMIPSVVDGFKPGQRKVMHACFRKKLHSDMKVAQLSGYVAEHTAYHHGEVSLQGTIIGMAQNFVGSNNINLLVPSGQFGTRIQGGKDHAASRYIFTRLAPVTRCVFPEVDDAVLEYLNEEGLSIEPKWYCPIIPLALVNGAEGIGVGWSTSIPNYNPREIIQNVRRHLRGEELQAMHPWYRGFKGSLTCVEKGKFECTGVATTRGRSRVEITELPVGRWTQDYKEWALEQLPKKDSDTRSLISEFREYHTETSVHFSITVTPDKLANAESKGLHKTFHCAGRLSSTNMWLFDASGKLKKFETPEEILTEFAKTRLETYQKRKDYHIFKLAKEAAVLNDKARFVLMVVEEELIVENRPAAEVCKDLRRHGFRTKRDIEAGDVEIIEVEAKAPKTKRPRIAGDTETAADMGPEGYGYLVRMKLWTLTEEKVAELENQLQKKLQILDELRKTTLEEMWERDLVKLEAALDAQDRDDAKEQADANKLSKKADNDAEEAMINNQCVLVLCKNSSEIKRVKTGQWRAQRKGGKAGGASIVKKAKTKTLQDDSKDAAEAEAHNDEDADAADDADIGSVNGIFTCHDFDALLAFTSDGHVYTMQALDVPLKRKTEVGTAITTLVPNVEKNNHSITSVLTVPQGDLKSLDTEFVMLVTAYGCFKKIPLRSFKGVHIQRSGKPNVAIKMDEDDCLRSVLRATDEDVMVVVSKDGSVLPVPVRSLKSTNSLKGKAQVLMRFRGDDRIASCDIAQGAAPLVEAADASAPAPAPVPTSAADAEPAVQPPKAEAGQAAAASFQMSSKVCRVGGKFRRRAVADDDDSDEEMAPEPSASSAAPAPALPAAESSVESSALTGARPAGDGDASDAESAGDGDADEDEKEDGSENENEEAEEAKIPTKPSKSKVGNLESTLAMLIISNRGFGKRVLLKDFKVGKKRGMGQKGYKCTDGEQVQTVCIVPGDQLAKAPRKPLEPWELHKEHYIKHIRDSYANEELFQRIEEANKISFMEAFDKLTEGEQARFKEQQEEDQKAYEAAVQARKDQWAALTRVDQVIVCTSKGLVKRVMSATVGVSKKNSARSFCIVKLERSDSVMTSTVVSAADDQRDEVPNEAAGLAADDQREEVTNECEDVAEVEASN